MRLLFLFGSGISIPAGMPTVGEITSKILVGDGIVRHTDGNCYFGNFSNTHPWDPDEYVSRVLELLRILKLEIENYYEHLHEPHKTNYEDLYYVASQIYDSEVGNYDNPAVQPFTDKILPAIRPLFVGKIGKIREEWHLREIAGEATNYIRDTVWNLLNKEPTRVDHLNSLKEACLDTRASGIDVFTLNHDTVTERLMSKNGIKLTDGFGKPSNGVRYWDANLLETESTKVRLFKLHGSVNWFLLKPPGEDWSSARIGIPLDCDYWHTKDLLGRMQLPVDGRPMFLAGTFNKMLQYTSGIYAELFDQFYKSLQHTSRLVVCGYGFRDKGINTQIKEWIYSSSDKRILVIHPDPNKLKNGARGAISNDWDNLSKDGKLIPIPKRIEQTTWQDIKGSIQ